MGFVATFGERADGPCRALQQDGEDWNCGLAQRPGDFMPLRRGPTATKEAIALMIGAGAGCDEAGDEPDATALPKLRELQQRYLRRHGEKKLRRAVKIVVGE